MIDETPKSTNIVQPESNANDYSEFFDKYFIAIIAAAGVLLLTLILFMVGRCLRKRRLEAEREKLDYLLSGDKAYKKTMSKFQKSRQNVPDDV